LGADSFPPLTGGKVQERREIPQSGDARLPKRSFSMAGEGDKLGDKAKKIVGRD